jgi:hypothetical protein
MAYGTVKVDNITFDNGGSDQNVTVSGLYNSLTSGITVTGTISGAVVIGSTSVSGTTVQGASGTFTSLTGTTIQGTTATYTTGSFTSLTGTTTTGTTANFVSGVFSTRVSGTTVIATTGTFTSLTGTTTQGTTATYTTGSFTSLTGTTTTGTTSSFTSGVFTTLSGATATFTSGIIASGTATAPSLAILGDPNTGIYSPGADQLAVATNGTGRLFVDANGNIGIGTGAPQQTLDIAGSFGLHLRGSTYTDFSTFWGSGDNRAVFLPFGFLGSNGAFALSLYANGYRNSSGGFTYMGINGNTSTAAGFDLAPEGNIIFRNGTAVGTVLPERLRITSAGLVGIGTSVPDSLLEVRDSTSSGIISRSSNTQGTNTNKALKVRNNSDTNTFSVSYRGQGYFADSVGIGTTSPGNELSVVGTGNATAGWSVGSEDGATSGGLYNTGSTSNSISISADPGNVGANSSIAFLVDASERARIDSIGRLLIGTSTYSGSGTGFEIEGTGSFGPQIRATAKGSDIYPVYQVLRKSRGASIVQNNDFIFEIKAEGFDGSTFVAAAAIRGDVDGTPGVNDMPGRLVFSTTADGASSPTERMRITNDGLVLIGTTDTSPYNNNAGTSADNGVVFDNGRIYAARYQGDCGALNRTGNDGVLLYFAQGGTLEGDISVSGTTVSYNGAHLSRWSQLPSGQDRTEILRGSVLSNLDEMCEWGDEENEQLNRMKVSDVEGDKNVSGVFQGWDDDDDTYTNDFYCAMTGDFIIRIAEGVTVERGDLLMSAGDGTAKPQDDDIIRSKTIAKVTSTNVSCTYPDGSYCVPCVLMAC